MHHFGCYLSVHERTLLSHIKLTNSQNPLNSGLENVRVWPGSCFSQPMSSSLPVPGPPKSGINMDRPLVQQKPRWPSLILAVLTCIIVTLLISRWRSGGATVLRIAKNRVNITTVHHGVFEDHLPLRGQVEPLQTIYIETTAGGRVEEILVDDGAMVKQGQRLLQLSNPTLELNFTSREIEVSEHLDTIGTLELEIQKDRLNHRRYLVEANYNIARLKGQRRRRRQLLQSGAIGIEELSLINSELQYWTQQKQLTHETMRVEKALQHTKISKLQETTGQLRHSLELARKNLERLNICAPKKGYLTAFDVELGQNLKPGTRIGSIDVPESFKLTASIDQFYLARAQIGQMAYLTGDTTDYPLKLVKLHSEVNDGMFEAEFLFLEAQPQDIRKGQTLQFQLRFGEATKRLLIPNAAFYVDTGGSWMFVIDSSGRAHKRAVQLGRRNAQYIEVIDGLVEHDKVITSSYQGYQDIDTILLY